MTGDSGPREPHPQAMSACNELRGYEDVVVKVSSCPLNYSSAAVVLDVSLVHENQTTIAPGK